MLIAKPGLIFKIIYINYSNLSMYVIIFLIHVSIQFKINYFL